VAGLQRRRAPLEPHQRLRLAGGGPGAARARSHCRFALPLIHCIPESLTYSVPLYLKRQRGRAPGAARGAARAAAGRGRADVRQPRGHRPERQGVRGARGAGRGTACLRAVTEAPPRVPPSWPVPARTLHPPGHEMRCGEWGAAERRRDEMMRGGSGAGVSAAVPTRCPSRPAARRRAARPAALPR
jgi:hypothetical protein